MVSDFCKDKIFWTKSMNIDLARFMEDKPFIWNPKHANYTNVAVRDEAFAQFSNQYGEEISWQAVKDRWTNIRSTYSFYMRKISARKAKGENFRVNWFMWEPCHYLYDVYKTTYKKSEATKGKKRKVDSDAIKQADSSSDESRSEVLAEDSNISCEGIVDNLVTVFKGVQNDAFGIDNFNYAAVGQAVTQKLTELDSFHAAQLSRKIMEILEEYDENNPLNPNN